MDDDTKKDFILLFNQGFEELILPVVERIDERLENLEGKVENIENRMEGMEDKMENMEDRMGNMEDRMQIMDRKLDRFTERVVDVENSNTQRIALLEKVV